MNSIVVSVLVLHVVVSCGIRLPSKCSTMCPAVNAPVCGSSSGVLKTFSNSCQLRVYNCQNPSNIYTQKYRGECKKPAPNCDRMCTALYAPVCGSSNGVLKKFSNSCELAVYNCKNPDNIYTVQYIGECSEPALNCEMECDSSYQPICGSSNGVLKTFSSSCELGVYNCNNPSNVYTQQYTGECGKPAPNCDLMCLDVLDPVCGSSNGVLKTFSNSCELNVYNCKNPNDVYTQHNTGQCPAPICDFTCLDEYDPVCGSSNGVLKTFSNSCFLALYNCNNPNDVYTQQYAFKCGHAELE